jgi:heme oxygenase
MFDQVPDHWQRFGKTLARAANKPELVEDVIEGAHSGFECMQRWFQSTATRLRSTA